MNLTDIKSRFLISVVANVFRALITFASGIVIARGLSPSGYGDLTFLLGSFVAIRALLDMSSSSAFYTFISRHPRGRQFYTFYFLWVALQFVLTLILVALMVPADLFEKIWLGHSRETVVLAFVAVFMQQQVWQMVGQIGEAARKTLKVQLFNLAVAFTYLAAVALLWQFGDITVNGVLWLTICLYATAAGLSIRSLREGGQSLAGEDVSYRQMLQEYWLYCRPMMALSVAGFVYMFADKWMLQKFGGAEQQGFFQIAAQFAQVSLLATVSILNIFWKEIAEATARGDITRVSVLYRKTSRGLVMLSAVIAGLLLPWAEQIIAILLGPAYVDAWPVLAIMFLYPIHQSMGQIGGTMFMAGGHTKKYAVLSIATMLFTLPVSYLALAPTSGMLIPGFGLGAIGMACYMVLTGIVAVNIQGWVIARHNGWKFDWAYQAIGIPLTVVLGYCAKMTAGLIWDMEEAEILHLVVPIIATAIIYMISVFAMIYLLPWLIGMEKKELHDSLVRLRKGMWRANS